MTIIRDKLLVKFVGFPSDVINENGVIRFRDDVIVSTIQSLNTLTFVMIVLSF